MVSVLEIAKMINKPCIDYLSIMCNTYYNIPFTNFRCDFESVGGRALIERMKFNILEIQENFENFLDKKEMTFEVSIIKISIY